MNPIKTMLIGITALTLFTLAGCSSEAGDAADTNTEKSTATSQETFTWKMVSTWSDTSRSGEYEQEFVDLVDQLSNGRLKIKRYSQGQLVSPTQVLDTVSKGTVQAGGDWPNYWSGKNTAFDLLGSHVMGFSGYDFFQWIYAAGGLEQYNRIYGKFNTVYFPITTLSTESGIRSNVPIRGLEDYKGLKVRIAGLIQTRVMTELGASPVSIGVYDVYEALQRGVVDAGEVGGPDSDEILHLQDVTKYWSTPGWHQSAAVYGIAINKDAWNELPEDLQNIVATASEAIMARSSANRNYMDGVAAQRFEDEYGIEVNQMPDQDLKTIEGLVNKAVRDIAAKNPDFQEVLESQQAYLKAYAPYRRMQGPWSFGTNELNGYRLD